jgi:hypothetical protein
MLNATSIAENDFAENDFVVMKLERGRLDYAMN